MDYHKSMKNYLNSKLIYLNKILKKNSYVITDKTIPAIKKISKITQKRKLKKFSLIIQKRSMIFQILN